MKKLLRSFHLIAAVLFLFIPTSTHATDYTASPWKGFYIGGNLGAGVGGNSKSTDLGGFNYFKDNEQPGEVTDVENDTAFIGGGQIGYNYLINRWLIGIEADVSSFDFDAAKTPASSKADWASDTLVSVEMNWLATVRGRLGVTMDHWLIYATGGAAFSNGKYRNHDFCNDTSIGCGSGLLDAQGDMGTGWTVGGGVELALKGNWTAKAEYLFVGFDGVEYSGTAYYPPSHKPVTEVYSFSASPAEFNIIRLGLNYNFGNF